MGESGEFSEQDFEACFKEFDKDGNGTISKDEMKIFIKKVAGL
jgi:Ca2+-binding EF-hand superfamily protein